MTNEETDAPAGTVIAQSPDAGTQVERGSLVNVVVSQARTTVPVPSLPKLEEADAIAALANVDLQMGTVNEENSPAASGTVLSQNPLAGEQVVTGTAVNVTVSRQLVSQLTVMMDHTNPDNGRPLGFGSRSFDPGA